MPKYEALWLTDLVKEGIGWVIVARLKAGGQRVEAGTFLVDTWCPGAKWAAYEDCTRMDYLLRIRAHCESQFAMTPIEPCCARKLVEQSVQYAHALGFVPHPEYRRAGRVFGGVTAADCPQTFTLGHEGKPLHCRGPRETEADARRIVAHLERRCGSGNYHYLVRLDNPPESATNGAP